jgi:hypothetical protein
MRKTAAAVTAGSFAFAAVVACGGSTAGSGGGGGGGTDINSFANQFCALYEPCCADAGLPANGQQCQVLVVALGGSQGKYDAAAGSACLQALQQLANEGKFCSSGANAPECNKVFAGSSGGTQPPGAACAKDSDCASSADGKVTCAFYTTFNDAGGSSDNGSCVLEKPGNAGDSPCIATVKELANGVSETLFNFGSGMPPAQGFACDEANNLYCDSQSHACAALSGVGGACQSSDQCTSTAYCDYASHACVARAQSGASCSGGALCAASLYCDMTSKTCTPSLGNGVACSTSDQCQSSQCINGKCSGSGNLGLQLICGS